MNNLISIGYPVCPCPLSRPFNRCSRNRATPPFDAGPRTAPGKRTTTALILSRDPTKKKKRCDIYTNTCIL